MSLTSDNGQLGGDRHLPLAVARHALVGVFIPGCSERLDPQHGAGALVELDCLDSQRITERRKTETIRHSRGDTLITFSGVNHRLDSFRATMEQNALIPLTTFTVLLLAACPHARLPQPRGIQCPAGGHRRRADALPTQGAECNKSRQENASNRYAGVQLRALCYCRNSFARIHCRN